MVWCDTYKAMFTRDCCPETVDIFGCWLGKSFTLDSTAKIPWVNCIYRARALDHIVILSCHQMSLCFWSFHLIVNDNPFLSPMKQSAHVIRKFLIVLNWKGSVAQSSTMLSAIIFAIRLCICRINPIAVSGVSFTPAEYFTQQLHSEACFQKVLKETATRDSCH